MVPAGGICWMMCGALFLTSRLQGAAQGRCGHTSSIAGYHHIAALRIAAQFPLSIANRNLERPMLSGRRLPNGNALICTIIWTAHVVSDAVHGPISKLAVAMCVALQVRSGRHHGRARWHEGKCGLVYPGHSSALGHPALRTRWRNLTHHREACRVGVRPRFPFNLRGTSALPVRLCSVRVAVRLLCKRSLRARFRSAVYHPTTVHC